MAFWGIEIKPGKPYVHRYDGDNGRLHVSQATLGTGSSAKKSVVQCKVGDKAPIFLCSMLPERIETCALNLEFEENEEVTFSVNGPYSVHLSGFFYGDNEDQDSMGNSSDSEGDIMGIDYEDGDDTGSYDSYEGDEDDLGVFPPSPVPNSGVIIEEILDDDKTVSETGISKQKKKKKSQSNISVDNENSNHQIVVSSGTSVPVLESEDEDGFPISTNKGKPVFLNSKSKTGDMSKMMDEKIQKQEKNGDIVHGKNLKRKIYSMGQLGEYNRDNDKTCDSSVQPNNIFPENDVNKKRNKKKKTTEKEESLKENDMPSPKSMSLPEGEIGNDLRPSTEKKRKKKNKKQNNQGETVATLKAGELVTDKEATVFEKEENTEVKSMQMRSFPNGLVIEELTMGKPDSKRASLGKKVCVHYTGKLKKNGKFFDSNIGRAPFKFRLGIGQVIKGWDVGVNGMRIGDKRRLTIPPAMGYGAKGCGSAIPPNSWLVFDVELADVN